MTKPIVLSLGELLWDMLPSGKRAGGAPVNFAYHAKMNGADGWSISAVGEDALGDELLAEAEKAGIHSIIQRNAWPTSTVEVSLKNGIPEYTIVKGVAWDHLLLTRQLIEVVEQADAICYGTLALRSPETHDTIIELLKHTKPGAMKFFDINLRGDHYSKELIEELLKVATVFKINDEELLLLRDMFDIRGTSGEDASRWFLEEFDLDYVILTAGSAYSTIISRKGEVSTLDTPRVEVNDTVGAGDSFSGTFTARILLGDTLAEAHRKAVNTAAFVCTQAGAWPEYPAEMPDYLAISVGDGCTIAGVWKGFKDLYAIGFIDKLPRLISAQSYGCYPINRAIQENKPWEPMEENTIADSISVGVPRNADKALAAIRESKGLAICVTDEEILAAQRLLGRTCGVFGEPAGVTGTAALKKACEQGLIEKDATVVSVVTGNGLKDVANAIKSAGEPLHIEPDLDLMVKSFAQRGVTVE